MKAVDRLLQAVAADEPHGVVGPAVGILAQAVDRHDARVLQAAGDLGLQQEAGPAVGVVGMPGLDLLQRHLAVEFLVAGHGDLSQPAFGMGAEDAEPRAGRGGTADRKGLRGPRIAWGMRGGDVDQRGLHVGIGKLAADPPAPSPGN